MIVIETQGNYDILDMSNRIPLDRRGMFVHACAITGSVPQDGSALNPR